MQRPATSSRTDAPAATLAAGARWRLRIDEKLRFQIALVAPAITVLALFQVLPIVIGANASFRNWSLYNPQRTWVGFEHYLYVLTDPEVIGTVLPNTFILMVASVSISLVIGLALAHLLTRDFGGRRPLQTIVLLPLMIGPVITATMMRWTFNDQFGVVAAFVDWLGFGPVSWLAHRWSAFSIIIFTDVWLWTPWFTILLLAGLKSLPSEPFEAAAIDAASRWRMFTHLTLPMLRPVIAVCVVIRAIDAFRTFDEVWLLTGGGPGRSTEVFSVYAYMEAFQNLNFARGAAAAVIGTIIILVIGLALYAVLNRAMEVSR
jgi:multiple sugar transport system permease protein